MKWRISKDENRTVVCLTSQPHKPSTTGPSLEAVQQVASSPVLLMSENLEHFIQDFVKIKTFTYALHIMQRYSQIKAKSQVVLVIYDKVDQVLEGI